MNLRNRKLTLLGIIALTPMLGFVPTNVRAESNLIEVYKSSYVEEPMLGVGELAPNIAKVKRLEAEQVIELAKPKKPRIVAKTSSSVGSVGFCSCVLFAKSLTGYSSQVGNARNWLKNSKVPVVGGVVITNESYAGHVGVVTAVRDGEFDIVEANYSRCRKGTRTIKIGSKIILGYWNVQ